MALTNCPGDMIDLQAELGISDDEYRLEIAGNAAARQIEGYTGWTYGFWTDTAVSTRFYDVTAPNRVEIPQGISTDVGLVVKTDTGNDGMFATTLTLNTNFILLPFNALVEVPPRPYTELRAVDYVGFSSWGAGFPSWSSGRPGVQVTAKFGWSAVPDDVKKAWLIQSVQLYKSSDAVFGAIQLGEGGFATRIGRGLNPQAESLVERYRKLVAA